MTRGAIILCGGESSRMGQDKAALPFGPGETMLQRVERIVCDAAPAENVVCVAAPGQKLPPVSEGVSVTFDAEPHLGPLAGLAAGMRATAGAAEAVFVTGCDMPLLVRDFITRMFDMLGEHEIAAPHDGSHWHPLAAVYRTDLLPRIEERLAGGERSLVSLLEACETNRVATHELRDIDPRLQSLETCNTPDDYRDALCRASLQPPSPPATSP